MATAIKINSFSVSKSKVAAKAEVSASVIALAICLILAYRCAWRLMHPFLWAEDGCVFLAPAWANNSLSLLFQPYAWHHPGYLHLFPRIVAGVSACFSFHAAPWIFAWSAFAVMCAPVFLIMAHGNGFIKDKWARLVVAVFYATLPFQPEVVSNPTNTQWFGMLVMVLLWMREDRKWWNYAATAILSLTGVFSCAIGTSVMIDAIMKKKRVKSLGLEAVLCAGGVIQLAVYMVQSAGRHSGLHISHMPILNSITFQAEQVFAVGHSGIVMLVMLAFLFWRNKQNVFVPFASCALVILMEVVTNEPIYANRYVTPILWLCFFAGAFCVDAFLQELKARETNKAALILSAFGAGVVLLSIPLPSQYEVEGKKPVESLMQTYDSAKKGDVVFLEFEPTIAIQKR
jgi:hypothetical protein